MHVNEAFFALISAIMSDLHIDKLKQKLSLNLNLIDVNCGALEL